MCECADLRMCGSEAGESDLFNNDPDGSLVTPLHSQAQGLINGFLDVGPHVHP